jgi:hypothetical protein
MNGRKNPTQYKLAKNTWTNTKERFFVAYAVEGPMINPSQGLRAQLPVDHPIRGPVKEPSPLNTRWQYSPPNLPLSNSL